MYSLRKIYTCSMLYFNKFYFWNYVMDYVKDQKIPVGSNIAVDTHFEFAKF